ncbi:hypothetical protein P43SY_001713 [Pythium insidiosum]|uniref:CAF1B/HIR1 beta-propeller domain-containing protein n=1 Tax=Pythium insidiosum TaxID=114742 RepID=A0AAD5LCW6_PYTIN|nr:hypothetical protein P43SY_001713 [Pythium insidiosum]
MATDAAAPPAPAPPMPTPTPVRVVTPEIRWHCGPTGLNEAVLSLDFLHVRGDGDRDGAAHAILATGGADKEIKLWRVRADVKDSEGLEFVFSLTGHERSVNCVRFSPNGLYLASASDDSSVTIWTRPKTAGDDWRWDTIASFSDITRTLLSCGHKGDITDLAWSPDSAFLCSVSVDNSSVIWNIEKGEVQERRKDHTQYVQGVAWDPLGEFLVTEGNDRTCRVYTLVGFDAASRQLSKKQNRKCMNMQTIKSREFPSDGPAKTEPAAGTSEEASKGLPKHRMFLDDTLTWTPDGNYLLAPTGVFRKEESAPSINTVYVFARGNISTPAFHLPGQEKASLGVRCSPLLYKLRDGGETADGSSPTAVSNFFQSQYRSIFAVITLNAVIVYDSQQEHPICTIKNLHYADLTDATWSADGHLLSVSSMDGYVSFIQFEQGFFGANVSPEERLRVNNEKTSVMFAPAKTAKKKAKTTAASTSHEETATASEQEPASTGAAVAATSTSAKPPMMVVKKKAAVAAVTSPILQAFKKRPEPSEAPAALALDASADQSAGVSASPKPSSSPVVNTLLARKKRKITPTLVTVSPASTASAAPATIDLLSDAAESKADDVAVVEANEASTTPPIVAVEEHKTE